MYYYDIVNTMDSQWKPYGLFPMGFIYTTKGTSSPILRGSGEDRD